MRPLSDEELAEGRRLDAARTPGPWTYHKDHRGSESSPAVTFPGSFGDTAVVTDLFWNNHGDGGFIAWAGTHVGALLDEVERLRQERAALAKHDGVRMALESALRDVASAQARIGELERIREDDRIFYKGIVETATSSHAREEAALESARAATTERDALRKALEELGANLHHDEADCQRKFIDLGDGRRGMSACTCDRAERVAAIKVALAGGGT